MLGLEHQHPMLQYMLTGGHVNRIDQVIENQTVTLDNYTVIVVNSGTTITLPSTGIVDGQTFIVKVPNEMK